MMIHRPVLLKEAVDLLVTKDDGLYIDGTLGAGGHAAEILKRLGAEGRLIGIDRDSEILEKARERLGGDARVVLHHGAFDEWLDDEAKGGLKADGLLLDLGVSSLQFDEGGRGFSFAKDGPLDMRMDASAGETAAEYLERVPEKELETVLKEFGEERFARRIAREVIHVRRQETIETTARLAAIVARAVPRGAWPKRIHPATRTFQALRIAVNRELERLERVLKMAPSILKPGGRMAVISYHSLEDRRVKVAFAEGERAGIWKKLTKKPVVPSEDEVRENPRSRSAKLRVAEYTGVAA
ncbi:MAG TPA: 16S rRNA (cytosine(1402)-N(4))-methyltransferase RsmH [bacterium]|nr:16S rRNA (cytosine(1402)-N(4))-methyltransferase RsmH [bacterium]